LQTRVFVSFTVNFSFVIMSRILTKASSALPRQQIIDAEMLDVLKHWKQTTEFTADGDWIFASPAQLGRLPWSADSLNDAYRKAGRASGVCNVSTHVMRHTYRSWLDAVGTPIAVQQKLMRHADIRTTMNVYGDVVSDEMAVANGRIARLALNGRGTAGKPS
jgi:integrase